MARLIRLICAGTLSVVALVGCSDQAAEKDSASPEVATISGTAGPAASQSKALAADVGAMIRMDMTEVDKGAIYNTYYSCLKAQGVTMWDKGIPNNKDLIPVEDWEKTWPGAVTACKSKEPYLDPIFDKTRNPKLADQTRAWMKCLNEGGVEVGGQWDAEFFDFGEVRPGVDRRAVMQKCYKEAYYDNKP